MSKRRREGPGQRASVEGAAGFYAELLGLGTRGNGTINEGRAQGSSGVWQPQLGATSWKQASPKQQRTDAAEDTGGGLSQSRHDMSTARPTPGTCPSPSQAPACSPARFVSSGVHDLSNPDTTAALHSRQARASASTAGPATGAASSSRTSTNRVWTSAGIGADNVGYRLLKQAGWQEGQGLGAQQQGRQEPLAAHFNKGNRGIGFDPDEVAAAQPKEAQRGRKGASTPVTQPIGPVLGGARVVRLVEAELGAEDVETKVKRIKQVDRQEADDRRLKTIRSYLNRAFAEPSQLEESADVNPITRRTRLTASNPLLDDDD